jgi:hypothetical protein
VTSHMWILIPSSEPFLSSILQLFLMPQPVNLPTDGQLWINFSKNMVFKIFLFNFGLLHAASSF